MSDLLLRLRALLFRARVERELDEELGFHVEMQVRKNLAAGISAEEARRQAWIQFGVGDAVKEECRDQRGVGFLETLFQDTRYARRGFRRAPLFALTVVGTISLGLGCAIAVFTVFSAYVLRPQAVHDPDSLYPMYWTDRDGGHGFTWSQFQELRAAQRTFAEVSAWGSGIRTRMDGRFVRGLPVSGEWFGMLGVPPLMGRTISPADAETPGSSPVLVLSYRIWQGRFAADPGIVGRTVNLLGHPFEVIGVMPEAFEGLDARHPNEFWVPVTMASVLRSDTSGPTQSDSVTLIGRLKSAAGAAQAQADVQRWAQATLPPGARIVATRLPAYETSYARRTGFITFTALIAVPFLVVLLSACANVANMMLARALARQREIGIRLSLGAGRRRLIRQLVTEAMLLAMPAAIAAFAMSQAVLSISLRFVYANVPADLLDQVAFIPFTPDFRVVLFALVASVASALLFGLAPALQATRLDVLRAAHGDFSPDFRPARLRNGLVVAQVTVSALFLIVCGVFLRNAAKVRSTETGMRSRDVLELQVPNQARQRVLTQLRDDPRVQTLAAVAQSPLDSTLPETGVIGNQLEHLPYSYISPEYLPLFDMPILRGRNFTAGEAVSGARVGILSESAARQLWPNQEAVGRVIRLTLAPWRNRDHTTDGEVTIVGVVRDVSVSMDHGPTCLYLVTSLKDSGNLIELRVQGDPKVVKQSLDAQLNSYAPGSVERIDTMQTFVDVRDLPFRAVYGVAAVLGGIALLFTLSGIYGVLSYTVAQRRKEIGIRVAMGAGWLSVVRLVSGQCMSLAGWGVAIGVALALAAVKFASSEIILNPLDLVAYLGGIAIVLAACACGAVVPARRAARVDPIATLRYD